MSESLEEKIKKLREKRYQSKYKRLKRSKSDVDKNIK